MYDLANTELSNLFDMLSDHTSLYMKMLSDGATKGEFDKCRETIIDIQSEIRLRQNQQRNTAASATTISLSRH